MVEKAVGTVAAQAMTTTTLLIRPPDLALRDQDPAMIRAAVPAPTTAFRPRNHVRMLASLAEQSAVTTRISGLPIAVQIRDASCSLTWLITTDAALLVTASAMRNPVTPPLQTSVPTGTARLEIRRVPRVAALVAALVRARCGDGILARILLWVGC